MIFLCGARLTLRVGGRKLLSRHVSRNLSQPQNRPQHPSISHTRPTSVYHVEEWPEDSASDDEKGAALEELGHAFEVECELRE